MPTKKAAYKTRKIAKKVTETKTDTAMPKRRRTKVITEETKPVVVKTAPAPVPAPTPAPKALFCACAKAPALSALAYVVDGNTSKSVTAEEVAEGTGYNVEQLTTALSGILVRKGFVIEDKKGFFQLTKSGQEMLSRLS